MRTILTCAALFSLASCGGSGVTGALDSRRNAGPCPPVGAIYDAARIVEFDGETSTFRNIAYSGEIVGVDLFCRYVGDDPLLAEVEIKFAFGKGEKGVANRHVYPYFVAVTRRSGKVLSKQVFAVEARFDDGLVDAATAEVQRIIIPRADETVSGANFEVLVGFDLTEDQIAFNRTGSRFRLDAGPTADDS